MADINTVAQTTGTTPSLTTDYAIVSIAGAVRKMSLGLLGQVVGFLQGGTGASTTQRMQDKLREAHVSPLDFGATVYTTTATTTASDTAFTNALAWVSGASLTNKLTCPLGYFRLNNVLDIPPGVQLLGQGRSSSFLRFYTTTTGGCVTQGVAAADHDINSVYVINGINFHYAGTGTSTSIHGLAMTHKTIMDNCTWDGFPGCDLRTDTSWAAPTTGIATDYGPHDSRITDSVFTGAGQYGVYVRYSSRGTTFINCQFSSCNINGFRQALDGGIVTGTLVIAGQASYSKQQGYYVLSGTGFQLYGAYAEYNWTTTGDATGGYQNGGIDDFYFGDTLTNVWANIGVLLVGSTGGGTGAIPSQAHVRVPGTTWNGSVGSAAAWTIPGGSNFTWGGSSTQWAQTGTNSSNVQIWEGGDHGYGVMS